MKHKVNFHWADFHRENGGDWTHSELLTGLNYSYALKKIFKF